MQLLSAKKKHPKAKKYFLVILLVIVFWTVLLSISSPEELVGKLGIGNGYALLFFVSLFGGVSALTAGSYFGVLLTLAAGGLDPLILALVSGTAVTVGDTIFYLAGLHGQASIETGRIQRFLTKVNKWLDGKPRWYAPILLYLMASFTPMPNDVMAAMMGLARRPWVATVIPLVLGNITLTYIIAYLGHTLW